MAAGEEAVARIGHLVGQRLAERAGFEQVAFQVDLANVVLGFGGDVERIVLVGAGLDVVEQVVDAGSGLVGSRPGLGRLAVAQLA